MKALQNLSGKPDLLSEMDPWSFSELTAVRDGSDGEPLQEIPLPAKRYTGPPFSQPVAA
jgi:hypothetical protein